MGDLDSTTFQALGLTLTLVGLALAALVGARRGAASGIRVAAWALLPLAAALTGLLRLAFEVADAVVQWALRLAFSPVVWLGLVVAALSALLFAISAVLGRRGGPVARRPLRSGTDAGRR